MDKIHNKPVSTRQTNVLPSIYEHLTSWSHDMKKQINFGYIVAALNLNVLSEGLKISFVMLGDMTTTGSIVVCVLEKY